MLMALDMFVFEIGTLPYQQLQEKHTWRYGESERFRARPAQQFVGVGEETITLTGALYPGDGIGDYSQIPRLREMADDGVAYVLTSGTGLEMGMWIITDLDVSKSHFLDNGVPRKADFSLTLKRADD